MGIEHKARRVHGTLVRQDEPMLVLADDYGNVRSVPARQLVGGYTHEVTVEQLAEDLAASLEDQP